MIQIPSAIAPATDLPSSVDASSGGSGSGGSAPASFLSLLSRTMSAQAGGTTGAAAPGQSESAAGAAVLEQAMTASGQGATVTDQTSAAAVQGTTGENPVASLLASLLAGNGKTEPKVVAHVAGTSKDSSSGKDTSNQSQAVDPAGLALMQSMVVPAMAPVQDKVVTTDSGSGKSAASSQTDAIAGLGQGGAKGKNLPNLMAGLAAQQAGQPVQAESGGAGQSQAGTQNQTMSDSKFLDVLTAKAGNSAAMQSAPDQSRVQVLPAPNSDTASAALVTPSASGHVVVQAQTQTATAGTAGASTTNMQSSFGSSGWTQELGDKMVWMAGNRGHTSELILNPPSLGTVEVRLHVNGNDAGAQFFSANADVRSAIEAAMPKLKEMLAGAGIALGEAMVSNQSFSQRDSFQRQSQKSGSGRSGNTNGDDMMVGGVSGAGANMASLSGGTRVTGLLDYYA
jgi:flagellar hook-length control protein FliK